MAGWLVGGRSPLRRSSVGSAGLGLTTFEFCGTDFLLEGGGGRVTAE